MTDHDQVKRREVLIHSDRYPQISQWIERNPRSWVKAMLELVERSLNEGELPLVLSKARRNDEPGTSTRPALPGPLEGAAAQAAAPPAPVASRPLAQTQWAQPQHPQQQTGKGTEAYSASSGELRQQDADASGESERVLSPSEVAKRAAIHALMQNDQVF